MDFNLSAYSKDSLRHLETAELDDMSALDFDALSNMTAFDDGQLTTLPAFFGDVTNMMPGSSTEGEHHSREGAGISNTTLAPQAGDNFLDMIPHLTQGCGQPSMGLVEDEFGSVSLMPPTSLWVNQPHVPQSTSSAFFSAHEEDRQQTAFESQHGEVHEPFQLLPMTQLPTITVSTQSSISETPTILVGSVYTTKEAEVYVFRCSNLACRNKSFGRWADLKRHYNGAHAEMPVIYWCDVKGCERSEDFGDRPFPRKDKLGDHVEKMHGVSERN